MPRAGPGQVCLVGVKVQVSEPFPADPQGRALWEARLEAEKLGLTPGIPT